MGGKIEVNFSKNNVSIRFSKDNKVENAMNNLSNWNNASPDLVVAIVDNKAAIVQVYTSDGDFKFPNINAKTWSAKIDDKTYFMAASDSWRKSDLLEITCLMQFEMAALWIQIVPKIDESLIFPAEFFQAVNKTVLTGDVDSKLEYIGNIEDGDVIFWANPNWDEVNKILPQLKMICLENGFEWTVIDNRN